MTLDLSSSPRELEKLVLERSTPEQGKPVMVHVSGSRGHCGKLLLSFAEWLHFSKLIKEGLEQQKVKGTQMIEIEIKGMEQEPALTGVPPTPQQDKPKPKPKPRVVLKATDAQIDALLKKVEDN